MATANESPATPLMAAPRSLLGAVAALGLCSAVELFMLVTRGRFAAIIDDFEISTNIITVVAISWLLPVVLAVLVLAAIIKEFVPARRHVVDRCNFIVALIGVVCFAVYVAGVSIPIYSLVIGLS